jgi:exosome complex component RRP42
MVSQRLDNKGSEDISSDLTQLLSHLFQPNTLLCVDFKKLCIIEGSQCWVIYIDALVLSMAGNVVDALFLATKAALCTTLIPGTRLIDLGDGDTDFELLDDSSSPIQGIEELPICVTVNKVLS